MNKKLRHALITLLLLGVSVFSAASLSACATTCEVEKYIESVTPYLAKWSEAVQLAKSAPRVALTPRIEDLQAIRDEVAGMDVQSCLQEDHKLLLQAMDDQISGFISFLRQEPEATVSAHFDSSDANLEKWKDALRKK